VEQQQTVEKAERVIRDLEAKRVELVQRGIEIAESRKRLSFAAIADGDPKAKKELERLDSEAARHTLDLENILAALMTADARVQQARQREAEEQDRAAAREAAKVLDELVSHGEVLDDALADAGAAGTNLRDCLNRLHNLGINHPSHEMLHTIGHRAIRTAMTRSIWSRYFEAIAPKDRVSFAAVVASWRENLLADINRRLGEGEQPKGVAAVRDDLSIPTFLKRDPSPAEAAP
jgi:hypothetical protein